MSEVTLIPFREAVRRTCLSRWSIRKAIVAGRFPKPIVADQSRRLRFVESEIKDWIHARMVARDSAQGDPL